MHDILKKLLNGYDKFRKKYMHHNNLFRDLHRDGQNPKIMVISCCDSRVDPALILQCDPGDLFVVRNIANIVPPYENDTMHHGTSAALEFGINILQVKHLIIFGHSQCGGIKAWLESKNGQCCCNMPFVKNWVSIIDIPDYEKYSADECAKMAMINSYKNCMTFPWIKDKIEDGSLTVHMWFFDIKTGEISACNQEIDAEFSPLVT